MKLTYAREVLHAVEGKGYTWMRMWGLSTILEAIRTVRSRKSATKDDLQIAERIKYDIIRKE